MPAPNIAFSPIPASPPADFATTLIQRVRSLIARGQVNAASLLLPTLEKLCPDQDAVAIIAVEIALHRGDNTGAAAMIDQGLARLPQSVPLLLLRARLALGNRDLVGAALAAAEVVTTQPDNAPAKSVLGQALLELGQTDQAAICLREALQSMPEDMPTINALTRASPADAEVVIRANIANGTNAVVMRNALIGALLARKDTTAATNEIRNLTVIGQADAHTGLLAVQAAIDSENWSEAASLFTKSTMHLPRHA